MNIKQKIKNKIATVGLIATLTATAAIGIREVSRYEPIDYVINPTIYFGDLYEVGTKQDRLDKIIDLDLANTKTIVDVKDNETPYALISQNKLRQYAVTIHTNKEGKKRIDQRYDYVGNGGALAYEYMSKIPSKYPKSK